MTDDGIKKAMTETDLATRTRQRDYWAETCKQAWKERDYNRALLDACQTENERLLAAMEEMETGKEGLCYVCEYDIAAGSPHEQGCELSKALSGEGER